MSDANSGGPDNLLVSAMRTDGARFLRNVEAMRALVASLRAEEEKIREGGGARAIEAQHKKSRLAALERIGLLLDKNAEGEGAELFELGLHAAHGMYEEWG